MLVSALKFLSLHMAKVIREETVSVLANVEGVTSKKTQKTFLQGYRKCLKQQRCLTHVCAALLNEVNRGQRSTHLQPLTVKYTCTFWRALAIYALVHAGAKLQKVDILISD